MRLTHFSYLHNAPAFLSARGKAATTYINGSTLVGLPLELLLASQEIKIYRYGYGDPAGATYAADSLKAVRLVQADCQTITANGG